VLANPDRFVKSPQFTGAVTDDEVLNAFFDTLRPGEPTALLIDNNNFYKRATALGFLVNYFKLREIIADRCDLRYAGLFTVIDTTDINAMSWATALRDSGWDVVARSYRKPAEVGGVPDGANMDVRIALDARKLSPNFAHIILGTCDGGFSDLIDDLHEDKFLKISALTMPNGPDLGLTNSLCETADHVYDISRIKKYVATPWTRPTLRR
jgi:uncharacterized LabA/DUF88 family protein